MFNQNHIKRSSSLPPNFDDHIGVRTKKLTLITVRLRKDVKELASQMETMEQCFAVSFGQIFKKLDDLQKTSSGIEDRIIEDLGAVIRDQDQIKERMEVIEDETRLLPAISEDTDMIQEIMR